MSLEWIPCLTRVSAPIILCSNECPGLEAETMKRKVAVQKLPLEQRLKTFAEVLQTYTREEARQEAERWVDFKIAEKGWAFSQSWDGSLL